MNGSLSTIYGSLAELMHLELVNKEAYASIIIMDASLDWLRLPMLGLQIRGKEITADNAYSMEMSALSSEKRLIAYEVSREGIRTDCDSDRQVIIDVYTRLR